MPLQAIDFFPKGPVKSVDLQQFYDLLTGVMSDQPVTFSNVLAVGGQQGSGTVPLKLFGAPGQTSNLIDLYADRGQAQPGFGFGAAGGFAWGPGGLAPQDTTLSRVGTQVGHTTDTPGLLVWPTLEVDGAIVAHGAISFPSGSAIGDGGGASVNVGQHLAVQSNLYIGYDRDQYLHELRPLVVGVHGMLAVGDADPWAAGLAYAEAMLVSRGGDLADVVGAWSLPLAAFSWASNWVQFNPKFYRVTAGAGWPGVALVLDYDVDNSGGAGGRISMLNGKVGVGGPIASPSGELLQVFGDERVSGALVIEPATATLWFGGDGTTNITRSGPIGQVAHPLLVNNGAGGGLWLGQDTILTFYTPNDPQGGGNLFRNIKPSTRPAAQVGDGEIAMDLRLFVDGDITAGTWVHGLGFVQTSDASAKQNMAVVTDEECLARVRDPTMQVYSYELLAARLGAAGTRGYPAPTTTNIGFDAGQVFDASPEFAALDAAGQAVAVTYPNMAALLWGAVRALDARLVAQGR